MGVPKKARKLEIEGETWRWCLAKGTWWVNIWEPDGSFHRANCNEDNFDGVYWDEDYGTCGNGITPSKIRKYIEEHIITKQVEYKADPTAIPGKLYVYRERNINQGPDVVLVRNTVNHKPARMQFAKLKEALNNKKPIMLYKYTVVPKQKLAYAYILIGESVFQLKIKHPNTWRGTFARYEEWEKSQEAADLREVHEKADDT